MTLAVIGVTPVEKILRYPVIGKNNLPGPAVYFPIGPDVFCQGVNIRWVVVVMGDEPEFGEPATPAGDKGFRL